MKISLKRNGVFPVFILFLTAALSGFAQGTRYISPNNDGVQDALTVPFQVKDKRYIMEWTLVIEDAAQNVVRSIGNKENRPEKITPKVFFKLLVTPKQEVAVPKSVTWDGTAENGETVKDGSYFYYMTAMDDNKNRSTSPRYEVVVDNTPPTIALVQPSEGDKFFGAGAKAAITIAQSGSAEHLWAGTIRDSHGDAVNVVTWENTAPAAFAWDGRSGTLNFLEDGVYSYSIECVDLAGNRSPPARVTNIIYSGEKPQPAIAVSGSRYFSPNGDGVKDTLTFDVTVDAPATGNTLVSCTVVMVDSAERTHILYSGANPGQRLVWNGLDEKGSPLPEGSYRAEIRTEYRNGYKSDAVRSPSIELDITPPKVNRLAADLRIFSPDGDGNQDRLRIDQNTSANNDEWFGEIRDGQNRVVRRYDLGKQPRPFDWDGLDDNGALAPDGSYTYRLYSDDLAGNHGDSANFPAAFALDTSKTELLLAATPQAFSPNGDRVRDTLTFSPTVRAGGGVASYTLTIKNDKGTVLREISGNGAIPANIVWDGRDNAGAVCPDGLYTAALAVRAANGNVTSTAREGIILDTVFPSVELAAAYTLFSPDKDGQKDTVPLSVKTSSEARWDATITRVGAASAAPVRTLSWRDSPAAWDAWDGTDDSGNIVPDGAYRLELWSEDAAGNRSSASIASVTVDNRPVRAYITARLDAFSPLAVKAENKVQRLSLNVTPKDGIAEWRMDIVPEPAARGKTSAPVKTWSTGTAVPDYLDWDGKNNDGAAAPDGIYRAIVTLEYHKGNKVKTESSPFVATVTPPALTVATAPEFFSPDNDGMDDELTIGLGAKSLLPFDNWLFEIRDPENGKRFWSTSGTTAITDRILWDGRGNATSGGDMVESAMDYPYTFTVTDSLGLSSTVEGVIPVDILVILLPDGRLKIRVPSIYFKSNSPEFDDTRKSTNERVLKRVAASLNRFKEYTVVIEGHSNKVTAGETSEANRATANNLSENRAKTVMQFLVRTGNVAAGRLSTVGKGESEPLAAFEDRDNWWKNRRVEFILNK